MKAKRVTGNDLLRYIRNLNVLHNVDNGEAGSVFMEYGPRHEKGVLYRAGINATTGTIHITGMGSAKQVIEELRQKNWRVLLATSKATGIPPNRRTAAKDAM